MKTTTRQKKINYKLLSDELIANPTEFISNIDSKTLVNLIKYHNDKYHNAIPEIPDHLFDILVSTLKSIDPKNKFFKTVGAKVSKDICRLPHFMGSMNKILSTDRPTAINKWLQNNVSSIDDYILSDKLDGISGLFVCVEPNVYKLYTRGDGTEGTDISFLIKYIKQFETIQLEPSMAVRGEIIISKQNFIKYRDQTANTRNMIGGVVNSKTVDENKARDTDFVAYELISPWLQTMTEQFEFLTGCGFKIVDFSHVTSQDNINKTFLTQTFSTRIECGEYEIDGIIVSSNKLPSERSHDINPSYAFAYKDPTLIETANVVVIKINWNVSKDGKIIPTLQLEPTHLSGVVISNVTANNAKFVNDNCLGPGSVIELIRSGNVIPYINNIISSSSSGVPQFPEIEYVWDESKTHIIALNGGKQQLTKSLTFFLKQLNIKTFDESRVEKLIDAGIDSIKKLIEIKPSDISNIDGFKDKIVNTFCSNVQNKMKNITMFELMIASNIISHGIGKKKLAQITSTYPDIIELYQNYNHEQIINMIKQLDNFDTLSATYFADGLEKFIAFFNTLEPDMKKHLRISQIVESDHVDQIVESEQTNTQTTIVEKQNMFKNKIFVFSGFRNKDWEKLIIKNGGKLNDSVSSNTNLVVATQEMINEQKNNKIKKAIQLNIQIISKEQFIIDYL